jgi:hypothetical protein
MCGMTEQLFTFFIGQADRVKNVEQVMRSVKDGGYVILSTFDPGSLFFVIKLRQLNTIMLALILLIIPIEETC